MSSMNDRVVLVTGATSGIGRETAHALAATGATVLITARDAVRGEKTKRDIVAATGNEKVRLLICNLASLASVRECCSRVLSDHERLHVLVNNAGTWDFHRRESLDGIENIFAVNYLAPFLMTNLLLDRLRASKPARIISVISGLHWGRMKFHDPEFKEGFSGLKAYRQSKLALLLFTRLLARQVQNDGITVNCAEPGMVSTNLGRDAGLLPRYVFRTFGRSPQKGSETIVYLASADEVQHISGECFSGRRIGRTSKESKDLDSARRLWEMSMRYVQDYLPK